MSIKPLNISCRTFLILITPFLVPVNALGQDVAQTGHTLILDERVLTPDDGLLLGNGDLSVSVYQTADRIIWRFGKGDVWDRRLDMSEDPKPANIREIAKGIQVEGWKCPPYGTGPAEATRGTDNAARMQELCQGTPPSYLKRPYPCPKPVGELALQLPPDQMELRIRQELHIESSTLDITCSYASGVIIRIHCFVPPDPNVLAVEWKVEQWTPETCTGNGVSPISFSLYRWEDPSIQAFAARFYADSGHDGFKMCADPKATPLPAPSIGQDQGSIFIKQAFPPDPLFKDGFQYLLTPIAPGLSIQPVDMTPIREARIRLMPPLEMREGIVVVAVTTSSDNADPLGRMLSIQSAVASNPTDTIAAWKSATAQYSADFWSKSRIQIADPVLENLWYETLYARRCTTRRDTVPPGLFLPSTVQDYSHWHGDYHTNYNVQEPYWGDYTANHFELGDAYFKAMDFFLPIGRKIARDYYNGRGVFIQLSGYPIQAEDDVLGCVPMGRMAYMTGWAANQYWWRYLYSMDKEWLAATGYPVLKDCALFYTDFLKKGEDGLYHAFPSNQGEDGFTGNPKDYTDRPQVMQHMRYCLRAAIQAGEVLSADENLRLQWRDILDHCAGDDGNPLPAISEVDRLYGEANPPEFGVGRPYRPQPETATGESWPPLRDGVSTWYFGPYGWWAMQRLRGGEFIADRDVPVLHTLIERWRHPNGLVWGMAIANYGHAGAWTEALGVTAPLQEMMLQSWSGILRVFPAWPRNLDARFENFRAQGAFLVSAAWSQGRIAELSVLSERGGACRLGAPWSGEIRVLDASGNPQTIDRTEDVLRFETQPNNRYTVVATP